MGLKNYTGNGFKKRNKNPKEWLEDRKILVLRNKGGGEIAILLLQEKKSFWSLVNLFFLMLRSNL